MPTTPGQAARLFIETEYPELFRALDTFHIHRQVIGALGSVIGDWWENEGVECPETSMHHLCSSFLSVVRGLSGRADNPIPASPLEKVSGTIEGEGTTCSLCFCYHDGEKWEAM